MEENKANEPATLASDQVNQVAGGDGSCTSSFTISSSGVSIETSGSSVGDVLIGTYDGVVDATSHVIETVAKAL